MSKVKITIEDLFELPTAEILNPDVFKPAELVSADSRLITTGALFVALKGEKFDGHNFVREAVKKGASAVVIEKSFIDLFDDIDITLVTVDDSTKAYGDIAAIWRNKLKAKIISITGSNGKTSTKEMLSVILSEKFNVAKSAANNNNHIGVPLSILDTNDKCEALILEQGTNHFGEIEYSAKISKPDYAVLTNIGDSHLEFFINREGVYKEKSALLDETVKNKGICFLNSDDPIIKKNSKKYKNKITYGFTGKPDVKGEILGYTSDGKAIISVVYKNKEVTVELPVYGRSNAKNFLAVSAVAFKLGLTDEQIIKGVKNIQDTKGRLQVSRFENFMLIDDAYNANPASVEAAVEVLENITLFNKKVLVLGDMLELGKKTEKLHKDLNKIIPNKKTYTVLTIGALMVNLHNGLKKNILRKHFDTRSELINFLKNYNFDDSAVVVKGSRDMCMKEFIKIIAERG
jgi:UDP-N-acetylmuramoyl-tripeptide--D-alanyl-D-alanine ligase